MELNLRLATAGGDVFFGPVSEVSLRTSQGIVQLSPGNPTYLGRILLGRIDLRVGSEWLGYAIFDASASTHAGTLTVMAAEVSQLESSGQVQSQSKGRRILHE
jgi:F0F1-type ATP synthase epsilon subunit